MSMPAISRHLKVLEHAGLITRGREAQWRPCRIEAKPLRDVATYVERYRKLWEERLDRLDFNNTIVYTDIVRTERIVYDHSGDAEDEHVFHTTVTFEALGNRTRVTMRDRLADLLAARTLD